MYARLYIVNTTYVYWDALGIEVLRLAFEASTSAGIHLYLLFAVYNGIGYKYTAGVYC